MMDSRTGELYSEDQLQRMDALDKQHVVRMEGDVRDIKRISNAVRAQARAKNKRAKASRKKNR